jgi:hypothetical protein
MLRVPSLSIGLAGYWLRVVLVVVAIAQRSLGHSQDETEIGFAFPKEEREALVAARPDVFFLPCESELRFPWIEAWLDALDVDEMRELVLDACGCSCRSGSPERCSARQPRVTSRDGPGSNHAPGPVDWPITNLQRAPD